MQGDTLEQGELRKLQEKIKKLDTEVMQCDVLKRDLIQLIKKEVELIVADMNEVKRLSEKNCFEKKLYEFKDSLIADLSPFVTDERSNVLISKLDKEQDWLEEEEYSIEEYEKQFSPHQVILNGLTSLKQEANTILDKAKLFQQKVVQFEGISHSTDLDQQVTNGHGKKVLDYVGILNDFLEFFKNSLQRTEGKLAGFLTIEELEKGQYFLLKAIQDVKVFFPSVPTLNDVMVLSSIILSRMDIYQQVYHWNEDLKQKFLLEVKVLEPFFWMDAFKEYLDLFRHIVEHDILFISHQERTNFIEICDNLYQFITFGKAEFESLFADMDKCYENILALILREDKFQAQLKKKICQLKSVETHELDDEAEKALPNNKTGGWKRALSDFVNLVDIIYARQLSIFSFEQEKKKFEEYSANIIVHLEKVDLRVIEDIEYYIQRIQEEIRQLQKRKEAYSEVIVQLEKLYPVLEDVQSQTDKNKTDWKESFRSYLSLYERAVNKNFLDVISSEEKDVLLATLNEAIDVLDKIETGSIDVFVECMSSLYEKWDVFASRKTMIVRLVDEIAFLKDVVNKEVQYEIQSTKDFETLRPSFKQDPGVHKAQLIQSNKTVAVKVFRGWRNPKLANLVRNKNEHEFFKKLDYKNILKTYGMFEQNDFCYIISDFCSRRDIKSFQQAKKLYERSAFRVMKAVCEVLLYLKSINVILGSLDLSHVLVTEDYKIKVDVFSLFAKQTSKIHATTQSATGIDTWDLGCLLFHCLEGRYPFGAWSEEAARETCQYSKLEKMDKTPAADLISKMLQKDVRKRISFDDALKHEYFESAFSTSIFFQTFDNYKGLFESVLYKGGELERFVSEESRGKIEKASMNLQEIVLQMTVCNFEIKMVEIRDSCIFAAQLRDKFDVFNRKLYMFRDTYDEVKQMIGNTKFKKHKEAFSHSKTVMDHYNQVIADWMTVISTTDLSSKLPISSQNVQETYNKFLVDVEPFFSKPTETKL